MVRRLVEIMPCEQNALQRLLITSPFIEAIQAKVLLIGTKIPKFESYDGSIDPMDHLIQFKNTMLMHNFTDAMYCKAFATTFKSTARTWFYQLSSSSVVFCPIV